MKRSATILAAVVAAFLVGCKDSNPIDPSTSVMYETPHSSKPAPDDHSNIISLDITVTGSLGQRYSVMGKVKYTLTRLPILREDLLDVMLDTQAKVNPLASKVNPLASSDEGWTVDDTSLERVNLTYTPSATVDKWYFLRGGPASLSLRVQFDVTPTAVAVRSISIE